MLLGNGVTYDVPNLRTTNFYVSVFAGFWFRRSSSKQQFGIQFNEERNCFTLTFIQLLP